MGVTVTAGEDAAEVALAAAAAAATAARPGKLLKLLAAEVLLELPPLAFVAAPLFIFAYCILYRAGKRQR